MGFHRGISPTGLLLAGISSVIGSGWLFGPLFAAKVAGPAAILSWLIGGFLMFVIALTFAELGAAFPVAGGIVDYAKRSHGPLVGFMIGWMVWLSSVAVAPVETLGLIQYAANYLPILINKTDVGFLLSPIGFIVAAMIMLLMVSLNYYGSTFFSKSNAVITVIKLIVPTLTIIILFTYNFNLTNFHNPTFPFFVEGWHGVLSALPLGGVIYSFIGSNTVLQLAGEVKNPQTSLPLALIGSMLFCMILYTLLQTVFIGALSPAAYANGWHQLYYAHDSGPFSGLVEAMGLMWFAMVIYADALISPFGTAYVFTASTARVAYGLSEIRFFPQFFKNLNQRGVPIYSLIINYFVGLLLFLPFPIWQKLVSFIVSCFVVSYIIGPVSVVILRKTHPHVKRPYKLPFALFTTFIAFYICTLLIFWTGWETVYKMMIATLIGLGWYFFISFKSSYELLTQVKKNSWIFIYFISLTIASYFSTFGGGTNQLSFGADFLVLLVITLVSFCFLNFTHDDFRSKR